MKIKSDKIKIISKIEYLIIAIDYKVKEFMVSNMQFDWHETKIFEFDEVSIKDIHKIEIGNKCTYICQYRDTPSGQRGKEWFFKF
jgi:hypothetical protein